jgi:hypothetical protein
MSSVILNADPYAKRRQALSSVDPVFTINTRATCVRARLAFRAAEPRQHHRTEH